MVRRDPMQVDPEFRERMKALKRKIESVEGKDISIRELTKRIAKSGGIEELETKLINIKLKIKIDKRFP